MYQDSNKENNVLRDRTSSVNVNGEGIKTSSANSVAPTTTPSKARLNLGSASKYYFKYMNTSTKKKQKPDVSLQEDDPAYYLQYMNSGKKKDGNQEDDVTGLISIPGINFNNTSMMNASAMDASLLSIGASSSSSEESDLLNKSTLSDTTELTAANFVLAATSRQRIRSLSLGNSIKKNPAPLEKQSPEANKDENPTKADEALQPALTVDEKKVESRKSSPDDRRQSLRGASPSLRSRISASPKSLRKFTEDLKNSRIKRQIQREEDAKRRLSTDSDSMLLLMNAPLGGSDADTSNRMRLPPQIPPTSQQAKVNESHNTTEELLGAMDELFGVVNRPSDITNQESTLDKRASLTARHSLVQKLLESNTVQSQDLKLSSPKNVSLQQGEAGEGVPSEVSYSQEVQSNVNSPITEKIVLPSNESFSSPVNKEQQNIFIKASSSQKKGATPTKLPPTPQRVVNPRSMDSPARNTRSAKKQLASSSNAESTASLGDIADILGPPDSVVGNDSTAPEDSTTAPESPEEASTMRLMDSPARNTRSAKKAALQSNQQIDESKEESTASLGDITDILGPRKSLRDESGDVDTASSMDIGEVLASSNVEVSLMDTSGDETASVADVADILDNSLTQDSMSLVNKDDKSLMAKSTEDTASIKDVADILAKSPMRLTPNSHVKPTPTKLEPSPRRVPNPKTFTSPAKNTRSAKKKSQSPNELVSTSSQKRSRTSDFSNATSLLNFLLDQPQQNEENKRQRLSVGPKSEKDDQELLSPMPMKPQAAGILSSKKRAPMSQQRSVAFGSPEAAEYHPGSPSINFTPMPKGKVKELYAIPQTSNSANGSTLSDGGENTVEIEANLNVLVDKITVDNMEESPALSPIANVDDTEKASESMMSYDLSLAGSKELTPSRNSAFQKTEHTVELEGEIDNLLANVMKSSEEEKDSTPATGQEQKDMSMGEDLSPAESSIEMTDAQSIASINSSSKQSEKFTAELSIPIDAQKLDFSYHTVVDTNEESDSMDIDEGNTIELEGDMTSLLAAAGLKKAEEQTNISVDQQLSRQESTPVEKVQNMSIVRKSPVQSLRFSLSPNLSLKSASFDDLLTSHALSLSVESKKSTRSITHGDASTIVYPEVTLTFEEIVDAAGIKADETFVGGNDSLMHFDGSVKSNDAFTFENWKKFLEAVCGEVEKQYTQIDGTASARFSELLDTENIRLSKLQKHLRSSKSSEVYGKMKSLLKAGETIIESEWNIWVTNVLESFKHPLSNVSKLLGDETEIMNKNANQCDQMSAKLSIMAGRKAQNARRKSLDRRKSASHALEDEIRALEVQISDSMSMLDESKSQEAKTEEKCTQLQEIALLAEEYKSLSFEAVPSQKQYLTLKGLHSWNPSSLCESRLGFTSNGSTFQTSTNLTYELDESGAFERLVSLNPARAQKFGSRYNPTISSFLDSCVQRQVDASKTLSSMSASQIGDNMHNFMWVMGRLDQTAIELQSLSRRYKTRFTKVGEGSFLFSVEFDGKSGSVHVDFEIDHFYPSLPLGVQLSLMEGKLSLPHIQKALQKNAKPGFGNLSRACGIVAAFVG